MKGNAKDYVSTAQQFFTAYDAHDVDGMLGLCADGALGRYAPYGRESVVPIRGGIDVIWRAFPNAVPNFRVKVIELIPAEGNTVVIQAEMSGPIPAEVPGVAKKGQDVHIPHCYILRFDADGKITRLDAYWDNTVLNSIQVSAVRWTDLAAEVFDVGKPKQSPQRKEEWPWLMQAPRPHRHNSSRRSSRNMPIAALGKDR